MPSLVQFTHIQLFIGMILESDRIDYFFNFLLLVMNACNTLEMYHTH